MWHYEADGKPTGPVSIDELHRLVTEGAVVSETRVWTAGMSEWVSFAMVFSVCAECGKVLAAAEVARFGSTAVCAACKPVFLQKLREGVTPKPVGQRLATRRRRLGSYTIDTLSVVVILAPLQWLAGTVDRATVASQESPFGAFYRFNPENVLWAIFSFLFLVAINWRFLSNGQTIGKRAVGIKIVRKDGSDCERLRIVQYRLPCIYLGGVVPLVGSLFAFVDILCIFRRSRSTLHDDIADTKVIDVRET